MSVRSSLTKVVPMFALAAKPNMCTTSRLAAKPNPCFPPSLVKGVEGGTHWDFLGKKVGRNLLDCIENWARGILTGQRKPKRIGDKTLVTEEL